MGCEDDRGGRYLRHDGRGRGGEKKACGILVTDQAGERDLVTHIEETETQDAVTAALQQAKAKIGRNPDLAVSDFSPSMTGGIREVFGEDILGIDGFHVMQELNNGIRRDLLDFRDNRFKTEIYELHSLRDWVSRVQAGFANGLSGMEAIKAAGQLPGIGSNHRSSQVSLQFTSETCALFNSTEPSTFFRELVQFLDRNECSDSECIKRFVHDMRPAIPRLRFTDKGMQRVQKTLLKKLKSIFLDFRATLEEESTAFYKDHWILFFQPERMTGPRRERLDAFLGRYPDLNVYRRMTLQVGEIYRLSPEQIDGHQISDLEEDKSFSDRLNTAISTLKKNAASIVRFVELFIKHPELPRRCRASTEWFNVKFKHPFKAGNNLVKKERLLLRLRAQLDGEVEWRIPEATVI